MASHPPIPILELADHIERLKANDNLKFSQEYEVIKCVYTWQYFQELPPSSFWPLFFLMKKNFISSFSFKYDSASDIKVYNK